MSLFNSEEDDSDPSTVSGGIKAYIQKLFGLNQNSQNSSQTKNDLNQTHIKVLDSLDKEVWDVITPRSDICAVSVDVELLELCMVMNKSKHTRLLVYKNDLDDIIGFIHSKDVLRVLSQYTLSLKDNVDQKFKVQDILRKHIITTGNSQLSDVLSIMKRKRVHIAIVSDEYGGTDGMITIEDIIEELIGPINDEHDNSLDPEKDYYLLDPNVVIANGRARITDIEVLLNTDFGLTEEDDYDTIGGLVSARTGHMPKVDEQIALEFDEYFIELKVLEATNRKIGKVQIRLLDKIVE